MRFAALHMSVIGTTRQCPDVRDHGESWRVSGPSLDIGNLALMIRCWSWRAHRLPRTWSRTLGP